MAIELLSVIIPCFNEELNIPLIREEALPEFKKIQLKTEFIFVDDGSTDNTLLEIEAINKELNEIRIIRHARNRGLGAAVRSGISAAKGDAILTLDSDLTFHPRQLSTMLPSYTENVDAVLGSPIRGTLEGVGPIRSLLSRTVNLIYAALLGKNITSTSSIFRLYRAAPLKNLKLKSESFQINAEILLKLLKAKKTIIEVPVTLTTRRRGVSKISFVREIKNHLFMFVRIFLWRLGLG